jgi:phage gp46-like protein
MSLNDFEGDILFIETPDGGDIVVKDGLIVPDRTFSTAVYLSLFGGNKEDSGKVKNNKTWWGNTLQGTLENEKLVSRFQVIITGLPLTVKNVREAETAAFLDLKWLMDEGIADNILVETKVSGKNTFYLSVEILKDKEQLFSSGYSMQWTGGWNGGI